MRSVRTPLLEVAFEEAGPQDGTPLLLLHGWPDDARTWDAVATQLSAAGYRIIAPYLRGFAPTRFLDDATPRVASSLALAQDAIDLADALGFERCAVAGHDWGARTAYNLAALFPERLTHVAALSTAYQPGGTFQTPPFAQARLYWYQWFMCSEQGAAAVRADPVGFARIQWDTWGPTGWYDPREFEDAAQSFVGPDWVAITLNSYRARWREGEAWDPRYDALRARLATVERIGVPALVLHGSADTCVMPGETENRERFFLAGYRRVVIDGAGHFPQREAPDQVAAELLAHFRA
jgi:pimeloyl-ACP methyl ester carboxylesterase